VVLTHGENEPRETLARMIQQQFKIAPTLPGMGETVEL
jgi:predicted metal-dependent RNase